MFVSARSLASLVVCLGAAAGAHGQCNVYRWNVPDFDQKRNGLPGDGGMYCLPTSATNWMAYIANHGYPPMMAGPRDWPNQSNYSLVTATDSLMGSLMGTTTAGGTNGAGGLIGLQAYMFPRGPFLFTTTAWFGTISPLDMWVQMQTNGLVDICYGYFIPLPGPSGN